MLWSVNFHRKCLKLYGPSLCLHYDMSLWRLVRWVHWDVLLIWVCLWLAGMSTHVGHQTLTDKFLKCQESSRSFVTIFWMFLNATHFLFFCTLLSTICPFAAGEQTNINSTSGFPDFLTMLWTMQNFDRNRNSVSRMFCYMCACTTTVMHVWGGRLCFVEGPIRMPSCKLYLCLGFSFWNLHFIFCTLHFCRDWVRLSLHQSVCISEENWKCLTLSRLFQTIIWTFSKPSTESSIDNPVQFIGR